jgi:hypothetical protein
MPDSTLLKALARPWRRQKLLDAGVLRLGYANRGNGELEQELCEPHPAALAQMALGLVEAILQGRDDLAWSRG